MKQISVQFEKPWKEKHKELIKRLEVKPTSQKKNK
jgi:hypothetical protein